MYSERLAIAVKTNGKVLREFDDTVLIPFGTEYSILIKNLNTVRCSVKLSIDGTDIADGISFIIPANDSIEIERFVKSGNMKLGNRFKFIERTDRVAEHRGGNQVDDGLIRVEYEFEQPPARLTTSHAGWTWVNTGFPPGTFYSNTFDGDNFKLSGSLQNYGSRGSAVGPMSSGTTTSCNYSAQASGGVVYDSAPVYTSNDVGVTTPGSISNQEFTSTSGIRSDGVKHVMILKLKGLNGFVPVQKPVTVRHKSTCVGCGRTNKATAKFCVECGTGLQIVA